MNKDDTNLPRYAQIKHFGVFFLSVFGGGVSALFIAALFTSPTNLIYQPYLTAIPAGDLSPQEAEMVFRLMKAGVITPLDAAMDRLVDFYSTIITLLISLIGVISFIAYLYVKTQAEEHAADVAKKIVEERVNTYFGCTVFQTLVQDSVKPLVSTELELLTTDYEPNMAELSKLTILVSELQVKQTDIQNQLGAMAVSVAQGSSDQEEPE